MFCMNMQINKKMTHHHVELIILVAIIAALGLIIMFIKSGI